MLQANDLFNTNKRNTMLSYAITFLIIALIAALLGFGGIAGTAVGIAKILFFVFIVLFLISAIMHGVRGRRIEPPLIPTPPRERVSRGGFFSETQAPRQFSGLTDDSTRQSAESTGAGHTRICNGDSRRVGGIRSEGA
jgi:uncharacterized membrane protein YtjA (UPF0391 family)